MKNRFEIRGDVTAIFLSRKDGSVLETLIDTADLPVAQSFKGTWNTRWERCTQTFYVQAVVNAAPRRTSVSLHRLLTDAPKGTDVDHINHDTLDNRQQNLRIVTRSQNLQNRHGRNANNTSGVRGVSWQKADKKWEAYLTIRNRKVRVGYFNSLTEAAVAVEQARERAGYLSDEPTKS